MADRTIYVGNLASTITKETLTAFLSCCGKVSTCCLAGDPGYAARFAFVEFSEPAAAQNACGLTGTILCDRSLRIKMSKTPITPPNPFIGNTPNALNFPQNLFTTARNVSPLDLIPRTVYASGIDVQISEENLHEFFAICGRITNCRLCGDTAHPSRFAFIEFETIEAATAALGLSGITLGQHTIKVCPSKTAIQPTSEPFIPTSFPNENQEQISRTIYVGSIDCNITDTQVQDLFSQAGTVSKMCLAGDTLHAARFAFIEFTTLEAATNALNFNGYIFGGRPIRFNGTFLSV